MKTIVFATSNAYKMAEIRHILPHYEIAGLVDIGIFEDIPETGATLQENAMIKAKYLFDKTGKASFSEDTGLEVNCLSGAPGVHTARYAGDSRDPNQNMELLLNNMKKCKDRSAQFRTVIVYLSADNCQFFEGIVKGKITNQINGKGGFGYDPVFIPEGYDLTFAELDLEIKNKISHRAKAVTALVEYLERSET